jgi:hypothetical protein
VREFERLPPAPSRDDVPEDERESYDRIVERTGRVHGLESNPADYFRALLNAPSLGWGIVQLGTLVRQGQLRGTYTDAERELVDVVYGEDLGYRGHYTVHIPDAFAVGVRPRAGGGADRRRAPARRLRACRRERHGDGRTIRVDP